jgi:hypothetical protein
MKKLGLCAGLKHTGAKLAVCLRWQPLAIVTLLLLAFAGISHADDRILHLWHGHHVLLCALPLVWFVRRRLPLNSVNRDEAEKSERKT